MNLDFDGLKIAFDNAAQAIASFERDVVNTIAEAFGVPARFFESSLRPTYYRRSWESWWEWTDRLFRTDLIDHYEVRWYYQEESWKLLFRKIGEFFKL